MGLGVQVSASLLSVFSIGLLTVEGKYVVFYNNKKRRHKWGDSDK